MTPALILFNKDPADPPVEALLAPPPPGAKVCHDLRKERAPLPEQWSELLNRHGETHLYNYATCAYFRCIICGMPDFSEGFALRNPPGLRCEDDPQDHDWEFEPAPQAADMPYAYPALLACKTCGKAWLRPDLNKKEKLL